MGVKIRKGGQWVAVDGAGGGITDVKQYSDNEATRTERTCSNPIAVLGDGKIIGIGTTSNAYGERYIQTTEPSSSCDGDLWFDTTDSSTSNTSSTTALTRVALIEDRKGQTTNGGYFTGTAWRDRDLNTISDPHSVGITSTNLGVFTLPKGTYQIEWSAPASNVGVHQTRLKWDTSASFDTTPNSGNDYLNALGRQVRSTADSGSNYVSLQVVNVSEGSLIKTFSDPLTYFKIQHYKEIAGTTIHGFGVASDFSSDGGGESIYTRVIIRDLSSSAAVQDLGSKFATIKDQKGQGQVSGSTVNNQWQIRDLNTIGDPSSIGISSVGDGAFLLPAGNYNINWTCPSYRAAIAITKLVYTTDSNFGAGNTTAVHGQAGYSINSSEDASTNTTGKAAINLSAPNYVRIEQLTSEDSANDNGNGKVANRNGIPEIYTMVGITQY